MFCKICGAEIPENVSSCPECGTENNKNDFENVEFTEKKTEGEMKSKKYAILLSVFLGAFGGGDFYLGYKKRGIIKLLLGCLPFTSWVSMIWSWVDAYKIYNGTITTDEKGNPLF